MNRFSTALFLFTLCSSLCSAVGTNPFVSLRSAAEREYAPIVLDIPDIAFTTNIELTQVAETASYDPSSNQPWVRIATGMIRFSTYLGDEDLTPYAMEFRGGPEDSMVVRCAFLTGEGEQFSPNREQTEVLAELSARWRNVPRQSFGMRNGIRAPAGAIGVQCVAYYGRGGINLSLDRTRPSRK